MNEEEKDKGFLYKIPNPFRLSDDLIQPEPDYFTAPFSRENISMYVDTHCHYTLSYHIGIRVNLKGDYGCIFN